MNIHFSPQNLAKLDRIHYQENDREADRGGEPFAPLEVDPPEEGADGDAEDEEGQVDDVVVQ